MKFKSGSNIEPQHMHLLNKDRNLVNNCQGRWHYNLDLF